MDSELPSSKERCKELIDLANNLSNVDICFLLNALISNKTTSQQWKFLRIL